MLCKTLVLEPKNVGLYTLEGGGGGLKKCTVCTLMKMLTFLGGPLDTFFFFLFLRGSLKILVIKYHLEVATFILSNQSK